MSEEIVKTFRIFNTIKITAASDKELQIKKMQKCLSNKQETKEKVLKENKELKKEMIHNYSTKNMKSPKKLRKIIILKKK